jgi:hypothetical protein
LGPVRILTLRVLPKEPDFCEICDQNFKAPDENLGEVFRSVEVK